MTAFVFSGNRKRPTLMGGELQTDQRHPCLRQFWGVAITAVSVASVDGPP